MDIPINAEVVCIDGVVGKSTYIIVDLVSEQVTHFVVKTDHPSKEYLVPINEITGSERSVILIDCYKEDLDDFYPFHKSYFNGSDAYENEPPLPSPGLAASYTMYHPYRAANYGTDSSSSESHYTEIALNKGALVLATDGEVGTIDELLIDPETHHITHLILRQHFIFNKWIVTVPVADIERTEMNAVYLKIDKKAVEALPTMALKRFPWE
jgi:sporulation protein YlmC with PRC-barrel domain